MANPTKILAYDLDGDLSKVFQELALIKGSFSTLDERFNNLDVSMFAEDEAAVVQDLIDAFNNDFKGHATARIRSLETGLSSLLTTHSDDVTSLQEQIDGIDISAEQIEMGNFNEVFAYDTDGNVKTHTVTGDSAYTVTYNYKTDGSGELTTSVKEFTDADNNAIKITKTYTYTAGDITGISTSTTVTPPTP